MHHINGIQTTCDHVKYVDDCTIREACLLSRADSSLQTAADEVAQWITTNKMALNYDKTKEMGMLQEKTQDIQPITINDTQVEQVNCTRLLGVTISHDLTWQKQIR